MATLRLSEDDDDGLFRSFLPKRMLVELPTNSAVESFLQRIAGFKIRGFSQRHSPEMDYFTYNNPAGNNLILQPSLIIYLIYRWRLI